MKVLIVDDEADIRRIGELSLKSVAGWEVWLAASGAEACKLAAANLPDLILLDMMMPEMDGLTTLKEIRKVPALKDTPVIFMTAKVQKAELARYKDAGASGVVHKPFDPMTLPDDIKNILGA